jgi:CheY-like chemotaxis protein
MANFADNVILVVDDDEMNLNIARMILEKKLSCSVITAISGKQALEVLNRQFVSLVLLDVMMPEMDGIETLEQIRAAEQFEDLPVMMLTASVDKDVIKRSIHLGVTDYIKKPFLPKDLIDRVSKKLEETEKILESILIIDGDENKLSILQEIMEENFTYKIFSTNSPEYAPRILSENNISLVIASAEMSFIEGFRLLNFMANDEKFDNVPFVLSTPENILETINKIKNPQPKKTAEVENDSAIVHSEKKKIANVVTNVIGYKLDKKI